MGRDTARDAISVLRREGRIVVRRGHASRVADYHTQAKITVVVGVDDVVESWMPSPADRRRLAAEGMPIPDVGVPVLWVVHADGTADPYPAHTHRVVFRRG